MGISLLLFVVGLKLDVRLLRRLGPVAAATGLGQVAFTSVLGYGLARALGFEPIAALYLALALTFSSTIVIVKLLADKRELKHLHGRIALGFLIVQDLVAILVMLAITAAGDVGDLGDPDGVTRTLGVIGRGVLLFAIALLMGRFVAPLLTRVFDRQSELLVLTVVTWAVLLSALSLQLGFSPEVGAFLAGISLASTSYRDAVAGRLATLRDFLLVFFFIELGTRFDLAAAIDEWRTVVVLSLFVLIGNPIVVMTIMGALGYRRQVSFKAGLTVAQISEFSLILVTLGVQRGHVGNDVLGLVVVIGLVTIAVSSELMHRSAGSYARLARPLGLFERAQTVPDRDRDDQRPRPEYVVIGVGRLGATLVQDLLDQSDAVLGVDADPRGIKRDRWHLPVVYGDADDPQLPTQLPLDDTRWVISTVNDLRTNQHLIAALREHGYRGSIAVAADDPTVCAALHRCGANVTIRPLHLAASPLIDAIQTHGVDDPQDTTTSPRGPGPDRTGGTGS